MEFIHQKVEREFERWSKHPDPYAWMWILNLKDVLRAHFLIVDYFIENEEYGIWGVWPRDLNLFESAVGRQFTSFGWRDKWRDHFSKCATMFYGIIKDHPFHDANKRTWFLSALYYLEKIGRVPSVSQKIFEQLALDVAWNTLEGYPEYRELKKKSEDPEVEFIANFLRKNTRKMDKKSYMVTFNQLDNCLRRFGHGLSNPIKGYIDVVRFDETRGIFGFWEIKKKEEHIMQISFPWWWREVAKGTIQEIRRRAKLLQNVDSGAFYKWLDPVQTLISEYSAPLRRLANK